MCLIVGLRLCLDAPAFVTSRDATLQVKYWGHLALNGTFIPCKVRCLFGNWFGKQQAMCTCSFVSKSSSNASATETNSGETLDHRTMQGGVTTCDSLKGRKVAVHGNIINRERVFCGRLDAGDNKTWTAFQSSRDLTTFSRLDQCYGLSRNPLHLDGEDQPQHSDDWFLTRFGRALQSESNESLTERMVPSSTCSIGNIGLLRDFTHACYQCHLGILFRFTNCLLLNEEQRA